MKNGHLPKNYLVRNAGTISALRAVSMVCGFGLDALILYYYGMGRETDALFAAFAVPLLITSTLDIQTAKVLVPFFTASLSEDGREQANFLFSNVLCTAAVFLGALSLLVMGLSALLMPLEVPGLDHLTTRTAVQLSMILSWLILMRGVSSVLQSVLLSTHRYFLVGSTKIITSTATMAVIALLKPRLGVSAVAAGYVAAELIGLLFLFPALFQAGYRFAFVFDLRHQKLRKMYRFFAYPLMGHSLGESMVLVENFLASFLSAGSLSALRYAVKIVSACAGVLVGSVVMPVLPLVSHYVAQQDVERAKQSTLDGIKLLIFISLPLTAWLFFTSRPLLALLFERGAYSRGDIVLTSELIVLLTPYILFSRIVGITQTIFYAHGDTKTPMRAAVLSFFVNVAAALVFTRWIGIYSFPLATSLASLATAVAMSVLLHRTYGSLGWSKLRPLVVPFTCVMLLTLGGLMLGLNVSSRVHLRATFDKVMAFTAPTLCGFIAFAGAALFFRIVNVGVFSGTTQKS